MEKLKSFLENPYYRAILWLALGVIIFFVGITRPKADTFGYSDFTAQLYDNSNGSLSTVSTYFTNASWRGTIPYMVANSSGGAWGISSGKPLLANHTYSFTIQISGPYGGRIVLSTYNRIGVGTTLANAKTSYQNNSNVTENYSNANGDNGVLQFAFTPSVNGSYIVFPFGVSSTGSNQEYWLTSFIIEDLGSGGVSETTINNSLSSQTNIINGSISTSENNIRSAINTTEQNIIDNQNSNQDQTNELLGNCKVNNYISLEVGSISVSSGTWYREYSIPSSQFSNIKTGSYYFGFTVSSIAYSQPIKATLLVFYSDDTPYQEIDITTANNQHYQTTFNTYSDNINQMLIRFLRPVGSSNSFTRSGNFTNIYIGDVNNPKDYTINSKYCTSKLDDTNQAINDVNDTLNDDNVDGNSASSFFEDFTVTDNGGISSIITSPLVAINAMLSNQCSPLSGTWRGQTFELPCGTDFWNRMSTIRTWLNVAIGGLLCYRIIIKLFKLIEGFKNPDNDKVEVMNL